MPLTVVSIQNAKGGVTPDGRKTTKPYKMGDSGGLYLEVTPTGAKRWRLKYRYDGKEKRISLGVYPAIGLKDARNRRDDAKRLLDQGVDPSDHRQSQKQERAEVVANSFGIAAEEWIQLRGMRDQGRDKRAVAMLERDLLPYLGHRPITEINAPELLTVLRRMEARGAVESAHRARQYASKIFRYAIAAGKTDRDPAYGLNDALKRPKEKHFSAITDPKEVGPLLVAIDSYCGTPEVRAALQLAPLIFCRPGELRQMEWSEVNFEAALIELPAEKMKMGLPHVIPLSRQALAILEDIHPLTGRAQYVFPSPRGRTRPLSDNAVRVALRSLGYSNEQMTVHGFRAMARTILDEVLGVRVEYIEHQLAHRVKDANGRAYNRTTFLEQRREMMQQWADYLDAKREDVRRRPVAK